MQTIMNFSGVDNISIDLTISDFEHKENRFYPVSKNLHKFDLVSVVCKIAELEYTLEFDDLQTVISSLWGALKYSLEHVNTLPENIEIGSLGKYSNRDTYDFVWKDKVSDETLNNNFLVWSRNHLQTWIYSSQGKLYLELSYSYPFLFPEDEHEQRDDGKFDLFIEEYKPLFYGEIPHDIALEWLQSCEKLIHQIGSDYVLNNSSE